MARLRREINIFNLSFLDVLSCGLGAVVVMFILGFSQARNFEAKQKDRERMEEALQEARKGFEEKQKVTRALKDLIAEQRTKRTSSEEEIRTLQRQLDLLQWINFVGIHTRKKDLLILMDLSGSMYREDENYAKAADKLVAISQALVQSIPGEEFRFNVMGFWGAAPAAEFPLFQPGGVFVPANGPKRAEAESWIKRTVDAYGAKSGGTPTWEALEEAFRYPALGAVILITDGAPNHCNVVDASGVMTPLPGKLAEFRRAVLQRKPAGVELHCIGVGRELYGDPVFRRFLADLAGENGGGFAAF